MTAEVKVATTKGASSLVLITVDTADKFAEWASGSTAVDRLVPGLGEMAFAGPQGDKEAKVIAFRKGARAVRLVSVLGSEDPKRVTEAELMTLAKQMESRLP